MLRALRLSEFLQQANIAAAAVPPLVHSTSAHRIFEILEAGALVAMPCNVFRPDKLCYCFVGRPAYKGQALEEAAEWQLPMAFVLRFQKPPIFKRVFPFDSGAFQSKRLPQYITMFKLDRYDLSQEPRDIGRVISFYFKDAKRYVGRRAAGEEELKEEHDLDMRHMEIQALGRLYREHSTATCDDRAAAIEVQIESDIPLRREDVLGIVVPDEFKRTPGLIADLRGMCGTVKTYPHLPLGTNNHYALIYEAVNEIYRKHKVIR